MAMDLGTPAASLASPFQPYAFVWFFHSASDPKLANRTMSSSLGGSSKSGQFALHPIVTVEQKHPLCRVLDPGSGAGMTVRWD